MANTFKSLKQRNIGTSATNIESYSAPGAGVATIIGLTLSNVSNNAITATVQTFDSTNYTHIVKNAPIPVGSSLVVVGGNQKVVLNATENVYVTSSLASSIDAIMSVLEVS